MKKRKVSKFLVLIMLINLFILHSGVEIVKAADTMKAGDTCIIRGGTYRETVTLNTSGTSANPISFQAYTGETVTVSGADPVTDWVNASGSIYYAAMKDSLGTKDQIFVNHHRLKSGLHYL